MLSYVATWIAQGRYVLAAGAAVVMVGGVVAIAGGTREPVIVPAECEKRIPAPLTAGDPDYLLDRLPVDCPRGWIARKP